MLADHRNYYKVEQWSRDGMRAERMLYAGIRWAQPGHSLRPNSGADRAACSSNWPSVMSRMAGAVGPAT